MGKNIVVAGHKKTVEAGQLILNEGGNAFDAMITAFLMSCVVESASISLGGGGFLLAQKVGQKPKLLDFFTQTPKNNKITGTVDFKAVKVDYQDSNQTFHIGLGSIAVPGNVAGVFEMHKQLGTIPLKTLAQPVIDVAKNGVKVDDFQTMAIDLLRGILLDRPDMAAIYNKNAGVKEKGDLVVIPYLADAIDALVNEGEREFYEGEFAKKLNDDCKNLGGYICYSDLKDYKAVWRNPLSFNYKGHKIYTNPSPSSGGLLIGIALKFMEQQFQHVQEWGSRSYIQNHALCMKQTNQLRKLYVDGKNLDFAQQTSFLTDLTTNQLFKEELSKVGSTTHISIIDKKGNAATLTHSSGEGSGYMIPKTGIMLNNMLGEADLNPQGFNKWPCNQRISSMMSPIIVNDKGGLKALLGSGGANRIRTALVQTLVNLIDYGFDIEKAIEKARMHLEGNVLEIEGAFKNEHVVKSHLNGIDKNHWKQDRHMFFGGVNGIAKLGNEFFGHADSRRFGSCSN